MMAVSPASQSTPLGLRACLAVTVIGLFLPLETTCADLNIGVLAFRGESAAMSRWSATAEYLNRVVPGERFRIRPLNLEQISDAVASGELDFVLTNTGNYVVLESSHGISRLATLKNRYRDRELTRFGAVIFSRRDNTDIRGIPDLAGKSFMAVSREAFGGFQMAWREMRDQGVDPFRDLESLVFHGFPQDAIVEAVISGEVDAGTVRAGTLDRMAADGLVDLDELHIINSRLNPGFPFAHSTRLYPEWPFAKTRQTSESLAQKVAVALLSMPPDSKAATGAGAGWTIPLDYGSVHTLFRELGIGPYAELTRPALDRVWREYRGWILAVAGILLLLGLVLALTSRANRRISLSEARLREEVEQRKHTEELLAAHRDTLERRVTERTAELATANEALRHSESTLRRMHDITAAHRVPLETQIEQLLAEGCRYFRLARGWLVSRTRDQGIELLQASPRDDKAEPEIPGKIMDLAQTLHGSDEPVVAIADSAAEPSVHAAGALLATLVETGDEAATCLVFTDPEPRHDPFSDVDIDILLLMAGWLGSEWEKQDISRRSEEHRQHLAHVTRLGSMGEMAAGIAHELNQPLTAIVNYANGCSRLIRQNPGATTEIGDAVSRIAGDALRAAETIRRLRGFLRQGETRKETLTLSDCVDMALDMVDGRLRHLGIQVSREVSPDSCRVEADRIQVEQVITNLLLNSMDALEHNAPGDRRIDIILSLREGLCWLDIVDNGAGISDAGHEKIFHPFFTTKSEGMGMGLSISRTIAEAHGGTLQSDRTRSGRTRLRLTLPAALGTFQAAASNRT